MHACHYTRSIQARQNAKAPTCSPIDPAYYNQKEEGPPYATAEVGARNRMDPRDVQDARSSSKGAKRHRTKGDTHWERGTTVKQLDIKKVGVLAEELFS